MVRMRLDISGPAYPEIGEAPAVWPRNTNVAAARVAGVRRIVGPRLGVALYAGREKMRAWVLLLAAAVCPAQVIEFESGGLRYQTLTKNGVTVMFAHLHARVREYATMQVAVSNGSGQPVIVRPDDFVWELPGGKTMRPVPARKVVAEMLEKGGRGEVVGLVSAYETGLYGMTQLRTTSGYESRRRAALAEVSSTKLKAAAAASAIAFVQMKLAPGESTDGAMFYSTAGKPLPGGTLHVRAAGEMFEFQPSEPPAK